MVKTLAAASLAAALVLSPAAAAAPQSVSAHYDLSRNGTPVAVMQETYTARDGSYQIVSETQAVGVLALLQRRPGRVTSSGSVGERGLQPKSFEGTLGAGNTRRVQAAFDWTARTLTLIHDGNTETLPLPAGTQDRLSVMYQFLFLDPGRLDHLSFAMTNGRKLDQYQYGVGPDTALDTPLGRLAVVHLVKRLAPGDTATEIWLARDHGLMPVKMRITEDDGSRYEQTVARLEIRP